MAGAAVASEELDNRQRIMRVLRNPRIRRLQLAFLGSTLGDWAYATAIVVWAYQDGGAAAVGAYQAVRFVTMAVIAPIGGVIADRMSRRMFMIASDLLRAGLVAAAGVIMVADGPSLAVYVLAILAAIVGSPFRAAEAGLLTELVESPSELTTANALSANIESVMLFAGPALAGLIIGLSGVEEVLWLNAATLLWSAALLLSIRTTPAGDAAASEANDTDAAPFSTELTSGFTLVGRSRDLRGVGILAGSIGFAWGALSVFMVLLATDVLKSGPNALGYLNAVLGVATVAGSLALLGRLGSSRLGQDLAWGVVVGWGLPLLAVAAFPSTATLIAALVVVGLCEAPGSLGLDTIPQRLTPSAAVSRVYAAIESCLVGPMAVGALIAPALVDWIGLRGALAVVGALPLLAGLASLPRMRDLDRRLEAPAELDLLRGVPAFTALPAPALERLAHTAARLEVPAGSVIVTEGGTSDRFYVIVSGEVQITQAGRELRVEGPGEYFGEIGLLRNVLRTATVTALADSELLVIDQADFLRVVSHRGETAGAFDDVIRHRLYS